MASGPAISKRSATGPQRPPVFSRIKQFLIEAWLELQKVLWPSKEEAIRFTMVVVGVIIIVAIFLFFCDFILSRASTPLFNLQP